MVYHNGFYLLGNGFDKSLHSIINENNKCEDDEDEEPGFAYQDAHIFLIGRCDLFAVALKKEFGYEIIEWYSAGEMVHSFCVKIHEGYTHFIDVRGITTNFNEFKLPFSIAKNEETKFILLNRKMETFTLDEEYGINFAQEIIKRYYDFYRFY